MGDQMAVGIVIAAGCWLIGLGFLMLLAPGRALAALGRMGGSQSLHLGEMTARSLIGVAIIVAADGSRHPTTFIVTGAFLITTAVALLILPRRWHGAYSTWWAAHLPRTAVRVIAPVSWTMGGLLIWGAL